MALLEFPQDPLHVSCLECRSHSEVDQARIPGVRGALRAKSTSEDVSSRSVHTGACRGFGSVSRRAVNGETEGLAGPQGMGRQPRRREHEGGAPLAGTQRRDRPCAEHRGLAPVYPSIEISIQTGEKSKRFYKEYFRNNFWDELPSQTLSLIGALSEPGLLPQPAGRAVDGQADLRGCACRFASGVLSTDFRASGHVDGGAAPPVRLDEQALTVRQKHVHGLKGRGGTRMIQDLRNRRFHGGTHHHGNPPRRALQAIRRSSRRPTRWAGPPTARLR